METSLYIKPSFKKHLSSLCCYIFSMFRAYFRNKRMGPIEGKDFLTLVKALFIVSTKQGHVALPQGLQINLLGGNLLGAVSHPY